MPDKKTEQCSWAGCSRLSEADLAKRALCIDHFRQFSDTRLESIRRESVNNSGPRKFSPEGQNFLSQLISQTTLLATGVRLLAPVVRADLIELSTAAAEIYRQLHREPRLTRRVPCLLRTGIVAPEISELCFTVDISARGACLEVRQSLTKNQEITLERPESGACTRARVAWSRQGETNKSTVGVELLGNDDFWGLAG